MITGVLESMERETAQDLIQRHGGRVTGSVSKKTSYIVVGDEPGETKLKKVSDWPGVQKHKKILVRMVVGETKLRHSNNVNFVVASSQEREIHCTE